MTTGILDGAIVVDDATTSLNNLNGLSKSGGTMTGNLILNADATQAMQPVTYQQFQGAIAGFTPKAPCYAATTANFSATYNNGSSGVGATLTATSNGVFTTDGTTPAANSRIFIPNQTDQTQNGIYTLSNTGSVSTPAILTRATDYDNSPGGEVVNGTYTIIENGTTYGGTTFYLSTTGTITIGTSTLTFTQTNFPVVSSPLTHSSPNTIGLNQSLISITSSQITDLGAANGAASLDANGFLQDFQFSVNSVKFGIVSQSTTTRTLLPADGNCIINCTNSATTTITVDTNANQAIKSGSTIVIRNGGGSSSIVNVSAAGGVTLNNSTGLSVGVNGFIILRKLQTNTWDVVDVFEEYTHTTNWSGIWASNQAGNVTVTRRGRLVNLVFPATLATQNNTSGFCGMVTVLPSRFRPTANQEFVASVTVNGAALGAAAATIFSDGNISILGTSAYGNFTAGTGTGGFNRSTVTYALV